MVFFISYQCLFETFNVGLDQRPKFNSFSQAIIKNKHFSSPEIQRKLKNDFCRMINVIDPFKEEKAKNNPIALELYKEWKQKVLSTLKPIHLALQLSIAGQIMDYGTNNRFRCP